MLLRIVTALMDILGVRENRMIPSSIPISSQLGYHMIGPCVILATPDSPTSNNPKFPNIPTIKKITFPSPSHQRGSWTLIESTEI